MGRLRDYDTPLRHVFFKVLHEATRPLTSDELLDLIVKELPCTIASVKSRLQEARLRHQVKDVHGVCCKTHYALDEVDTSKLFQLGGSLYYELPEGSTVTTTVNLVSKEEDAEG